MHVDFRSHLFVREHGRVTLGAWRREFDDIRLVPQLVLAEHVVTIGQRKIVRFNYFHLRAQEMAYKVLAEPAGQTNVRVSSTLMSWSNENKSCMRVSKQEFAWEFHQLSCPGQTRTRVA